MLHQITNPDVQQFIRAHEHDDETKLVLKHSSILGLPAAVIAQQIVGRRKVKDKIPVYYQAENIIYPPSLNLEQSSSEATARYKIDILKMLAVPNTHAVDLTGGFGVDSFFLSQYFKAVTYVEPNGDLLDIARHNHAALSAHNITYHNQTAEQYIQSSQAKADLVFIDPSRRSAKNQRLFRLDNSVPNIVALRENVFTHAPLLVTKASPLLDISVGVQELRNTKHIFVVSVNNECRELLFLCNGPESASPQIHATDIKKENTETMTFNVNDEQKAIVKYSGPRRYLYEPNTSILKAGAFKLIAERFDLPKLHVSTHLYTSDSLVENFPGRIFEVEAHLKSDLKTVQAHFERQHANVLVRNYPLSPEDVKSKFKLRDGGEHYLICFSGVEQKYLTKCRRLK
jgi:hypothetical protein